MIKKIFKNKKGSARIAKRGGFTLVETLFYIALLAIFSIVIINTLLVMTRSFRATSVSGDIVKGSSIMERISREIKQADGISSIGTNTLVLNTQNATSTNITLHFLLSGSDIDLQEDSVSLGNLNPANITVNDLTFTQITTTAGVGVKVYLSITSDRDSASKVYEFYDTLVLRGAY